MAKALYTPNPPNVIRFFATIQGVGVPTKVNRAYLATVGFKSSNDHALIGLSKSLGFLDASGNPMARWSDYKDKNKAPKVMTDAIKTAYTDLYSTYPDAEKKDDATLQNYFARTSGVAESVARLMVRTFKNLCGLADFGAGAVEEHVITPTARAGEKVSEIPLGMKPITLNINIQLQLPATEDATIYEALFSALKKNLFT